MTLSHRRFSFLHAFALVIGTVPSASAHAQSRPDSAPPLLPAVSVTATRTELVAAAQPISTSVFTAADLRASGVTQLADVLRLVPGATVLPGGSFGAQTGLFLRGGETDYTLVLVDGVPLNTPGGFFDFGQLTVDNIERVEVTRGPASILYGSDAVSGVVQIFTTRGAGAPRASASVAAGNYGARRVEGTAAGGDVFRWSVGGARHASAGILPFNNDFTNDVASAALSWTPGPWSFATTLRYTDHAYRYPTDGGGALVDSNTVTTTQRLVSALDARVQLRPAVLLSARASRNRGTPSIRDLPDGPADTLGFFGYISDATVTRDLAELRSDVTLGAQQWSLIVEHGHDREVSSSTSFSEYGDFPGDFSAERRTIALATQLLGNLGARTTYVIGGRRDDNSAFGVFHTGRAALAHAVTPSTSLRASVGNAFKAPTFFENFATGFTIGDPALRPERTTSVELGLAQTVLAGRASVGATYFAQRFRDIIQYAATVPTGTPNYANLAAARADGVEFEARWRLGPALQVHGGYTWLDTEVTDAGADEGASATFVDGDRLLRRPTHLAVAGLRWTPASTTIDVSATRTGARDDRDFRAWPATPVEQPAFTRVDVAVMRALPFVPSRMPVSATLRVENLLDVRYEAVANFRAPGRTVIAGLRAGR
mgnify:CR=1 FL=1